jgi:hypothetical protein
MVLEVAADTWDIGDGGDVKPVEGCSVTDSRQLQELRSVNCPCC